MLIIYDQWSIKEEYSSFKRNHKSYDKETRIVAQVYEGNFETQSFSASYTNLLQAPVEGLQPIFLNFFLEEIYLAETLNI